jgi:adenosylcobinamide-GDP ribazoletransferase
VSEPHPFLSTLAATAAGWWRDVRQASAFLTRLPLPVASSGHGATPQDVTLANAARAFPIVGAAVGAIAAAVLLAAFWLDLHPLACALFALAASVLVTGALHEDGLADVADGFGGGADVAAKLDIMRDSRVGTYGVLAVVFSIGLRAALLSGMAGPGLAAGALIAAGAASRGVLPMIMQRLPLARTEGLAHGAGSPNAADALTAAVLGGLLALLFLTPSAGIAAIIAAAAAAALVAALALRQIGGHTGDVLGAAQQVTEIAVLTAVAAASV